MRKITACIAAIAALVGTPVLAADMAVKAPVMKAPPPAISWAGIYVGGQVGYAWSNSSYTYNNGAGLIEGFSFNPSSAIGGGHIGIQGQWATWVLGLEGDFNWTDLNQTDISVLAPPRMRSINTRDISTVVGKVGYAWDHWLLYVKGGWADARINTFVINPATGILANPTAWQGGATVGGGLDYMMAPNWIAGVDFNYYTFKFDRTAVATDATISTWTGTRSDVYAVMGRLSYLFNFSK
jgi:outer membrane immunogenic protein